MGRALLIPAPSRPATLQDEDGLASAADEPERELLPEEKLWWAHLRELLFAAAGRPRSVKGPVDAERQTREALAYLHSDDLNDLLLTLGVEPECFRRELPRLLKRFARRRR